MYTSRAIANRLAYEYAIQHHLALEAVDLDDLTESFLDFVEAYADAA